MLRLIALLAITAPTVALEPVDIIVITNKAVPASCELAEHYCKARGVPAENIVPLELPKEEDIGRADYNAKLVHCQASNLG